MKTKSIKTAIILPLIPALVVGIAVLTVIVAVSATVISNDVFDDRIATTYRSVVMSLDDMEKKSNALAISAANNYTVLNAVRNWNNGTDRDTRRVEVLDYLTDLAKEAQVDSFILRDRDGVIVVRVHDPNNYGTADNSPAGNAAAQGRTTTSYSSTPTMALGLNTTTPIMYRGEIIGSIAALYFLHTDDFVNRLSETFEAQFGVFGGDTKMATTLRDQNGQQVLGTIANDDVVDAVLGRGESYRVEKKLFGHNYISYYFPVLNLAGSPIGMIFMGFSTAQMDEGMRLLVTIFLITGFIITVAISSIVYFVVRRSLSGLTAITAAAEALAIGDIEINIPYNDNAYTKNEVTKVERSSP
jgi:hypothetical protein